MAGPFITRDFELFAQLESAWGTSPGALAGADAFKSRTKFPFKRNKARYDRDNDMDNGQRSVLTTQGGRESGGWSASLDVIPSGVSATPTEPDVDPFLEAHLGTKHKATAHTTTTAGSVGTDIILTGGGVAASGIQVGDLIAVDVSTAVGYEVRQVVTTGVGGADHIAVDRAFTTDPASGRTVKVGTTYRLSASALKSVHLWGYLNGDNFRHKMPGAIVKELGIDIDFNGETPVASMSLSGDGQAIATHATARPTPVTAGQPLLPSQGKVFIGASGLLSLTKAGIKSVSALELRQSESTSLFPTGVKGTANKARYNITQTLEMLLMSGTIEGYYDNAAALTAYDVIVQLGITPGQIVAWRTPSFIPDVDPGDTGDEVTLSLAGRCYGLTNVDTEVSLAFL
jgi:hypothetical protein